MVCTAHCAVILHWVSLCTEYYVQCQAELKIILDQCPDIEEIYIFLYTARSAAKIGICATLDQEKDSFPFAFGYRKIMILFPTAGALRSSKTYCKIIQEKYLANIIYCSQTSQL